MLYGRNKLNICNPLVYGQYENFCSVGACISPSIRKRCHRLVLTLETSENGKIGLRGIPRDRNSEKQCFGIPRRVVFLENEPSGSPETYLSLIKLQTYENQNRPKRQEGASKFYFLTYIQTFIREKRFTRQQ